MRIIGIFFFLCFTYKLSFTQTMWGKIEIGAGVSNFQYSFPENNFNRNLSVQEFYKPSVKASLLFPLNRNIGIEAGLSYNSLRARITADYNNPYKYNWSADFQSNQIGTLISLYYNIQLLKKLELTPSIGIGLTETLGSNLALHFNSDIDTITAAVGKYLIVKEESHRFTSNVVSNLSLAYQLNSTNSITFNINFIKSLKDLSVWKFNYQSKNNSFYDYGTMKFDGDGLNFSIGYLFKINSLEVSGKEKDLKDNNRNIIYLEGGGIAEFASLNYERSIIESSIYKMSLRLGTGINILYGIPEFYIPISINNFIGNNSSFIEYDLGYLFMYTKLKPINRKIKTHQLYTGFGYRYQKYNSRLFLKTMVYLPLNFDNIPESGLFMNSRIGIGAGYRF